MNEFFQTALTFPTLVYSVLLAVCVAYWLLAATGLVDIDGPDGLLGLDGDSGDTTGAAALLSKVGLSGVPLMLILTVLGFVGWIGTYFLQLLIIDALPAGFRLLIGLLAAVLMLVPGLVITSILLRPISRLLLKLRPPVEPSILGRLAIVSTPSVDIGYGQATVDDGGAGLILQVRHHEPERFKRGDRVVLIEYLDDQHAYRVISEQQFQSL
ncbi:MAG: DUF1449 family protein [Pseudomonadota bacterium]|nr:DUF1449 family protein [Pseudomonadota bacterium]